MTDQTALKGKCIEVADVAASGTLTIASDKISRAIPNYDKPDGIWPSGLLLLSAGDPVPDAAPEAWCCLGRSGLNRSFDLRRLSVELRFGGAITTTLGFDLLVTPRAGFDDLAAVDHIM